MNVYLGMGLLILGIQTVYLLAFYYDKTLKIGKVKRTYKKRNRG